ncbi:zinc finger CCCH domain-containing protein 22 [Dorcoceras hygrometricum]|uniref:Zinc finger CCCH domain-containing protein 22 n=1 Tax=Dorcoceras hygrometricum TaxID=472368 RepID=A0A2Z7BSR9_9LAMI|nr:zinc finger CCCH domain-containing protein 22 [Dorcoceras hygrometricum]
MTISARTDSPRRIGRNEFRRLEAAAAAAAFGEDEGMALDLGLGLHLHQLAVGPQPLRLRNHNSGLAHRIMVKRLATSPHDPLGITDSAWKNQLVLVSVQYGPFNPYIPIRSTTIGKSRVAKDPIAMHTSWRSNSDIASVTSTCVTLNGSGIQLAVGPQPLRLRNHNSGLAHRIMVKRLATSPHDHLGITDSACKNQLVVVSVQYGPFNPYIPIRSTTIGIQLAVGTIALWLRNHNFGLAQRIMASLPKIPANAKGKAPLKIVDPVKGNPAKEIFTFICADVDFLVQKREKIIDEVEKFFNYYSFRRMAALNPREFYAKEEIVLSWVGGSLNFCRTIDVVEPILVFGSQRPTVTFWGWSQLCTASVRAYMAFLTNIRKDMHDHKTALSLDVVKSHQKLSTQVAAATIDNVDVQKEVKEQLAILDDMDERLATVRSELFDFRAQAQENYNNLSIQLGFLVDYINRGCDAKKGEGGSSRPQPPPDDQARPSGGNASREGGNSGGRGSESSSGSKRRRGSGGGSRDRQRSSGGGSGSGRVTYGPYLPPKRSAKYWVYGEKEF